jgi:predicted amidohydrolase YtcJ
MTVEHLDRAAAGRPVVISHANGHLMNVNSAMLRLAEITRDNEVEGVVRFGPATPWPESPRVSCRSRPPCSWCCARSATPAPAGAHRGRRALLRPPACRQGVTTATDLVNRLGEQDCRVLEAALADDQVPIRILPAFQAFLGTARMAPRPVPSMCARSWRATPTGCATAWSR